MTRTVAHARAELALADRRITELEREWVDPTALPPEGLGDLYVLRDRLRDELAALEEEKDAS